MLWSYSTPIWHIFPSAFFWADFSRFISVSHFSYTVKLNTFDCVWASNTFSAPRQSHSDTIKKSPLFNHILHSICKPCRFSRHTVPHFRPHLADFFYHYALFFWPFAMAIWRENVFLFLFKPDDQLYFIKVLFKINCNKFRTLYSKTLFFSFLKPDEQLYNINFFIYYF